MRIERIQPQAIFPSKGAELSTYNAKGIVTQRAVTFENWKRDPKEQYHSDKKDLKDESRTAYKSQAESEHVEEHVIDLTV